MYAYVCDMLLRLYFRFVEFFAGEYPQNIIVMFKKVLAFVAIAYASASAAWTTETAREELTRLKEALSERMTNQGKTVDPANLVELYAFFKQATEGDKPAELSAGMDPRKFMMYTGWGKKAGMSTDEAVKGYKTIVKALGDVE